MTSRATSDQLTFDVVRTVVDHRGTDPTTLEPPLAEVVDPESLRRLFSPMDGSAGTEGYVVISYGDCMVMVGADGWVEVLEGTDPEPFAVDCGEDRRLWGTTD